ncbi:M14 family metallopeptidase [Pseudomonas sp. BMS12]|uniref:M14 family metallopeptidase n=1 Tax=Pseudomonas sp. BMS12 TaxID=1796033 RepID=UPI00083B15A3|nr:M14 family metallopeptidase [Pseudomonas sp. BMS12]
MDLTCFSQSYAEARQKFLDACADAGFAVESHIHPLSGRAGEQLAMDVARLGPANAANLLVLSSGCHGVEGFCGSAVQLDRLRDRVWLELCRSDDLAVLFIHALNPHGFSWLRRVTEDNVDLNRNFLDFDQPLPDNPDYTKIAHLLLPKRQPPTLLSNLGLLGYVLRHGPMALQGAISRGQSSDARGLFFAGTAPTWSNHTLRQVLGRHAQQCQRIGWIDVHTGLGPRGVGERIYMGDGSATGMARARAWWGKGVTSFQDGSSSSAVLSGTLDHVVLKECPQAEYNGVALEYGTQSRRQVLNALRTDHWLYRNPQAPQALRERVGQRLRDAFYVNTEDWKERVLQQAREVLRQTLDGLASPLEPVERSLVEHRTSQPATPAG